MNGLLDAKKCGWHTLIHGERREVMIATLRWAIVCTAAFPHVAGLCVEMNAGEGMAWWIGLEMGGWREIPGGKFYSWRRLLNYLSAYLKSGAFFPKDFFLALLSLYGRALLLTKSHTLFLLSLQDSNAKVINQWRRLLLICFTRLETKSSK